ncbi:MAG: ABC transporter permease, partial [Blastocatellia bacterium]
MLTESLNRIRMRLKALLLRSQLHRDLDDEIAFHLKMREDKQIAGGTDLAEARLAAQKRFGNPSKWKESCRDMWTFVSFETLVQDARYGVRTLVKGPVFFIAATFTLALGIGANTTIFSMVDSFLLRPLPVKDPAQITALTLQLRKSPLLAQFSIPEFQDIHNLSSSVFSDVMCFQEGQDGLSVDGATQPMAVDFVSGSFFSMMGIQPALGRFILPNEGNAAGSDPILVLGYSYWKTRFGGDPSIVGKQASVNGRSVTVIGVAPEGFHGTQLLLDVQGYLPFSMLGVEAWAPKDFMINRALRNLFTYARLKPGATVEQAQAELNVVADNIGRQYPEADAGLSLRVFPERLARP